MQTTLARFNAVETTDDFALQGPELLRVSVGAEDVRVRHASLVAHHGTVTTSKGDDAFARLSGTGEAFLGTYGRDVHLILLENEEIGAGLAHVLAWQETVSSERIEGDGDLTRLGGSGWVALTSHGAPVLLDVGATRTYAHPDALVAWAPGVEVRHDDASPLGLGFTGEGWALVGPARD